MINLIRRLACAILGHTYDFDHQDERITPAHILVHFRATCARCGHSKALDDRVYFWPDMPPPKTEAEIGRFKRHWQAWVDREARLKRGA